MAEPSKDRNARRIGRITRNAALASEVRGNRAYLSATRNPYGVPLEAYTGSEKTPRPPEHGTRTRQEWDKKIGELRTAGWSYERIANEMDTSTQTVQDVCSRHGFTKEE
jgi:hypothetical protein